MVCRYAYFFLNCEIDGQGVQRLPAYLYLPEIPSDTLAVTPVMYKVSVLMWFWSGVTCLSVCLSV